ncbi:hypothetical protein WH243_09945 [Acinetobacter sp. MYb177]
MRSKYKVILCVIPFMTWLPIQSDKPIVQIQLDNVGYNIVVRE